MKKVLSIAICMIALVVFAMWAPDADAFQFYSDATNDQGGCAQCHTGFRDNGSYVSQAEGVPWNNSLHNVHLNNTTIGSNCGNCHFGAGTAGRTVNLSSSEVGPGGAMALACMGCHGRQADTVNNPNTLGMGWGAGLRQHHNANGVGICVGCHADADPGNFTAAGEDAMPMYYPNVTNTIIGTNLDPCNAIGEEQLAGLTIGLDNDGDNEYDTFDADCGCQPTGVSETICNGVDDDCDGQIDEDYVMDDTCGVGVCGAPNNTPSSCVDGVETACIPGPQSEPTDVTCDGADGDCDGQIDEDFMSMPTTCGTGECASTGQTICIGGAEGDTCTPGTPSAELCDSLDNDCDGASDEDFPNLGMTCTVGIGACEATGNYVCTADGSGTECDATPGTPGVEGPFGDPTCGDGIDNDCDGLTDVDDGDCDEICTPTGVSETICNGVDDDCDGATDEDYMPMTTTCGTGECASTGQTTCVGGVEGDTCEPGTPQPELCDGLDNDCDGATDEDFPNLGNTCTVGIGACENTGTFVCTADGSGTECDATPGTPGVEGPFGDPTCSDTIDNDCDGLTDVDDGDCDEICTPTGVPETECNGIDDDCDFLIDEDYMPMATTCGVGECASSGQTTCVGGVEGDTCTPGTPQPELCDGLDNDCDSSIDEDFPNLGMMCTVGIGACENTGTYVCTANGQGTECDATPGTPGVEGPFGDPTCGDGIDNDCDGQTDVADGDCQEVLVDLDIARFRVSKSAKVGSEVKRIQLTVENPNGGGNAMAPSTLVGVQNGVEVYNQTRMVFDLAGNGRSRFAFPSYTPEVAGTINWTVTLDDDDPDVDVATASTRVR